MRARGLAVLAIVAMFATGCVTVERVDTSSSGGQSSAGVPAFVPGLGNSGSGVSGNGRYVVFASMATDLVPGVADGNAHVYRKDRQTGAIAVADVSTSGTLSGGAAADDVSDSGTRVVFRTESKLATNDLDTHVDAYVHDFATGSTILASLMPDGSQTPSGLGQGVSDAAFDGTGTKLLFLVGVGIIPPRNRIELRDLTAGTTTEVLGNSQVTELFFSRDGRHVFANTGCFQVGGCAPTPIVIDLANPYSFTPAFRQGADAAGISDDGQFLFYRDGSGGRRPIRYERISGTGIDVLVGSADPSTLEASALDGAGRFAVVTAPDTALPGGTAGHTGLFLVDVNTGRAQRTSADAANRAGNAMIEGAAVDISQDGRTVGFFSDATNLVDGDSNVKQDAFVRIGPTPVILGVSGGTLARGVSHAQVIVNGAELLAPVYAGIAGDGITVHSVTPNANYGELVLDVSVAANASTGTRNLTVANIAAVGHAGTICACITIT